MGRNTVHSRPEDSTASSDRIMYSDTAFPVSDAVTAGLDKRTTRRTPARAASAKIPGMSR